MPAAKKGWELILKESVKKIIDEMGKWLFIMYEMSL